MRPSVPARPEVRAADEMRPSEVTTEVPAAAIATPATTAIMAPAAATEMPTTAEMAAAATEVAAATAAAEVPTAATAAAATAAVCISRLRDPDTAQRNDARHHRRPQHGHLHC
jgi:hypothetical protein